MSRSVVDPELARDRDRLRRERLVQLDEIDVADREPGAVEQLAHRGHRPDPHHARVDAGDRRGDERAERLDAERARLLLRGDDDGSRTVVQARRVAGRDRAAGAERRLQRRELLECRLGTRMLVARQLAGGDELVVEAAGVARRRPALLRAERERVLLLARHVPALGDVLAGLAHRLEREHRLELRVGEAPAERRVVQDAVAARERGVRLRRRERRARHRLDTARDEEIAVAGDDRVARADDRGEPRRAEPVDGDAGDRVGQPGEQHRHPRDVAVVLARLVRAADVRVLDLAPAERRRARPPRAIASAARSSGRTPESPPP